MKDLVFYLPASERILILLAVLGLIHFLHYEKSEIPDHIKKQIGSRLGYNHSKDDYSKLPFIKQLIIKPVFICDYCLAFHSSWILFGLVVIERLLISQYDWFVWVTMLPRLVVGGITFAFLGKMIMSLILKLDMTLSERIKYIQVVDSVNIATPAPDKEGENG